MMSKDIQIGGSLEMTDEPMFSEFTLDLRFTALETRIEILIEMDSDE